MAKGKVAERIRAELRDMIVDGRLVAGTRVTELELAAMLKASRTPVREALVQLHGEGLVVRLPHSATLIRGLDEHYIDDALQLRALLEGYAALHAAGELTASQIADLERLADAMEREDGLTEAATEATIEYNGQFHQIILDASANRRLSAALALTVEIPRAHRVYHWSNERQRWRALFYHRELIDAFQRRDATRAEAVMKSHILAGRDFLVSRLGGERDRRQGERRKVAAQEG